MIMMTMMDCVDDDVNDDHDYCVDDIDNGDHDDCDDDNDNDGNIVLIMIMAIAMIIVS